MLFKSRHIGKLMLFYALHNTTTKNCFNRILYFLNKRQFSLGNCSSRNQMCLFYSQVIIAKQWQWQQHQLQMQKRSYSAYMSCQSSSSALSLTLQPTKKIFSWKLREKRRCNFSRRFSPFIEFLLFAQWHSVQKTKKCLILRPCAVQVKQILISVQILRCANNYINGKCERENRLLVRIFSH